MAGDRTRADPGDLLPAFLEGAARVLDIGATFNPPDVDIPANDAEAMRSDWSAVVADLSGAAKQAR